MNYNKLFDMNKYGIVIIVLLSAFLTACSDNKENDTWLVATSADNPPYEHMHEGNIEGFDIDLMNAIGKQLGKKIEFKNMEFHGLLAALSSNNVDMAIAAISVTKDRQEHIDFSVPYTNAHISVLYRQEDNFSKAEDLKNGILGAQLGTIWNIIAHDMSLKYDFETKVLGNNLMLIEELKNKRVDAVIMEGAQIKKFMGLNPEFSNFSIKQNVTSFSIAFPKGSFLKNDIDSAINVLKNNGTIDALSKKWDIISAQ